MHGRLNVVKRTDVYRLLCSDCNIKTFCFTFRILTLHDVHEQNKIKVIHCLIPSERKNQMSFTIIRNKCRIFCLFLFVKLDAGLNRTIPSTLNILRTSFAVVARHNLKASPEIFTAHLHRRQKHVIELPCASPGVNCVWKSSLTFQSILLEAFRDKYVSQQY